ncbi:MAG TPA: hypothetical protein VNJ12_03110 [Candidatus Dormibacteraeota bacterium]|nr:hypothetical protein [Candidatus Dormibacteraeota bacterium]
MTMPSKDNPLRCARPIDAAVLADDWLGRLPDSEEKAVEEHLLACDLCGASLREVIALTEGIRGLAREGSLRMVVSDAFIESAAKEGLRVREYAPPPGGSVACTVTAEDDILVARLAANLSGAKRVDLCICDEHRTELLRPPDIPVRPGASDILYQESIRLLKAAPDFVMIARLVELDESGRESLLGEYTFNHTRSLPGLGGQ